MQLWKYLFEDKHILNSIFLSHLFVTSICWKKMCCNVACEQALCLGKKIARKGKGRGERACRHTFVAAIPPSCNYLAKHLSARSLSVNQFRAWVTPGKIKGKTSVFCFVSKQSEMDREPNCRFWKKSLISGKRINTVPVVGVSRNKTLLVGSGQDSVVLAQVFESSQDFTLSKERAFPI